MGKKDDDLTLLDSEANIRWAEDHLAWKKFTYRLLLPLLKNQNLHTGCISIVILVVYGIPALAAGSQGHAVVLRVPPL